MYLVYKLVLLLESDQAPEKLRLKQCLKSWTYKLASKRSERDTIRGVQIRAGAVYI